MFSNTHFGGEGHSRILGMHLISCATMRNPICCFYPAANHPDWPQAAAPCCAARATAPRCTAVTTAASAPARLQRPCIESMGPSYCCCRCAAALAAAATAAAPSCYCGCCCSLLLLWLLLLLLPPATAGATVAAAQQLLVPPGRTLA
jgi:hypothetical protein